MQALDVAHHSGGNGMKADARRALEARRASLTSTPDAHHELQEIDAALERMDAGTWGRCETCGGAIGRGRLRALPEARHCLTCSRTE